LHQVSGEAGCPRCPVALPNHEEWRGPAFVTSEIKANEFAYRLDVAPEANELFRQVTLDCPAVACAHGIDKNQVCLIKPCVLVVDELIGRGGHHAVRLHSHALGAN